jgi:hypothetical protein
MIQIDEKRQQYLLAVEQQLELNWRNIEWHRNLSCLSCAIYLIVGGISLEFIKGYKLIFVLGLLPFFVWIFVSSRQHKRAFIAVRLNKGIDPEAAEQDYNKEYESS